METPLDRLKTYQTSMSDDLWTSIPYTCRAAVLIILFEDPTGQLSVIVTVRSLNLRTFPGQAAFPGGRCDHNSETAWDAALREANEEIGFDAAKFNLSKLCKLPCYLSRNYLVVKPCVCFVQNKDGSQVSVGQIASQINGAEVQVVYSVGLSQFLDGEKPFLAVGNESEFSGHRWIYYEFEAVRREPSAFSEWIFEDPTSGLAQTYNSNFITGLTAHMALDCARISYGRPPTDMPYVEELGYDPAVKDHIDKGTFRRKHSRTRTTKA
jgi:8-oxo-dGTP pyrophosphatase MutT (NUDIX family)